MPSAPNIRPVTRIDHDAWLPLWEGYNAFYGRAGPTALAANITAMTWERFFDRYEPMFCFVAERDGRLLGLTHFLLHRSTIAIAPSLYLQDIFTSEGARGEGIARALINAVYAFAESNGIQRVYWQTHESNATAIRLYDKIAQRSGFIVYRHVL